VEKQNKSLKTRSSQNQQIIR